MMYLHSFLDYWAREQPEAEFAVQNGQQVSYQEALVAVNRLANTLSDAGCLDDEGYLYVKGRVKDMIVSGSENVYPIMVENVLAQHPAIAEVAVIGVPDEKWRETVKAVVVLREGASAGEAELIEFCRDKLAGYERPHSVDFIGALPRTATGNVLKRSLREPYWIGRNRRVGGV